MLSTAWVIAVSLSLQSPPASAGSAPAWTDDRPLTRLVQNLGRDLFALPRPDTLAIVGGGALGAGLARRADDNLAAWAHRAGEQRSYTPIGGLLGNAWMQAGAAVATYAIGSVQDSAELAHVGSDLIRAQVLNGVLTTSVKLAADRTRPNGGNYSFPSGHTSSTFASATVLAAHYGWKVAVPAYSFAGFIAWTRVRDHEHWLSDVVFGSALGIAAGRAVTRRHGRPSWTVVPTGNAIYVIKN